MRNEGKVFLLKVLDIVIILIALPMVLYHMINAVYMISDAGRHVGIHLLSALVIVFLTQMRDNRRLWPLLLALTLLAVVCGGYVVLFFESLEMRMGFQTYLELAIGVVLLILSIEATRLPFGISLPAVAGFFILYNFLGHLLPGFLSGIPLEWETIISRLSLCSSMGILGPVLGVSASYIFLFMVFSALLSVSGITDFFMEAGRLMGRKLRAGPAIATVVICGALGTISGLVGPIIFIAGPFALPAMKKIGYTSEQAGAILAAGATGGPLIPPVMGVCAFLLASFTGTPYAKICLIAIIPGVLYVLSASLYCYFQGEKMKVRHLEEQQIDIRKLLHKAPIFFVPLAVMIVLFSMGYSAAFAAFWSCVTTIVVGLLIRSLSLRTLIEGFVSGARSGAEVAASCATIGIIVSTITMAGLGIKLPAAATYFCGGNLIALLILAGAICAILGMGMPPAGAYVLVVIAVVPALVKLGVDLLPAHYFVFYMANTGYVTPPVAMAALFAAKLSGSKFFKTGIQASLVSIAGFILPFMMIFCPGLVFDFSDPLISVTTLLACPLIFLGLQAVIVGYFARELSLIERIILFMSPLLLLLHIYTHDFIWFGIGLVIIIIFTIWQVKFSTVTTI